MARSILSGYVWLCYSELSHVVNWTTVTFLCNFLFSLKLSLPCFLLCRVFCDLQKTEPKHSSGHLNNLLCSFLPSRSSVSFSSSSSWRLWHTSAGLVTLCAWYTVVILGCPFTIFLGIPFFFHLWWIFCFLCPMSSSFLVNPSLWWRTFSRSFLKNFV